MFEIDGLPRRTDRGRPSGCRVAADEKFERAFSCPFAGQERQADAFSCAI
jgi:hypothetical protein